MIIKDTGSYIGLSIVSITDEYGREIDSIYMQDGVRINLSDGSSINIGKDWRGDECYLSEDAGKDVKNTKSFDILDIQKEMGKLALRLSKLSNQLEIANRANSNE